LEFKLSQNFNTPLPSKMMFEVELISGKLESAHIEQYYQGDNFGSEIKISPIPITEGGNIIFLPIRGESDEIKIYFNSEETFSIRISDIRIYPAKEYNFLFLEGVNSPILESNSYYGLQRNRTIDVEGNVAFKPIDSKQVFFRGMNEYIDTPVSVNGLTSDFSMMMSFSLPFQDIGRDQYLVNGTGPDGNEIFIKHITGNPLNILQIGFGKQMLQVTLNPSFNIHALCVVWDHNNQKIRFAKDGEDLSEEVDYVFDGQTNPVVIGAYDISGNKSFYGLIGEGIFSTEKIDNDDWIQYWDRVKNETPSFVPTEVECNEYYSCEEYWMCDSLLEYSNHFYYGDFLLYY
jgi:hypothetical protein